MSVVEAVDVGDAVLLITEETKGEAVIAQPTKEELGRMPLKERVALLSSIRKQRESSQRAERAAETAMYALAQDAESRRMESMCDDMSKMFLTKTERRRKSEEEERKAREKALNDFVKEKNRLEEERLTFLARMQDARAKELANRRVREQRQRESRSAAVAAS